MRLEMRASDQADSVSIRICGELNNLPLVSSESFIYKVHKQLRCINENAYEPEIVAIGPYHHDNPNLQMMKEHKLRYLHQMLLRKVETNAENYLDVLRPLVSDSRRCYAEPTTNLTDDQFLEMLLLDGCFVIEVILKFGNAKLRSDNDPIFQMEWILVSLQRDLMLFENQLPFNILCKLFELIEVPANHDKLMPLALCFFSDIVPGRGFQVDANSAPNTRHLLELIHNNWRPSYITTISNNSPDTMNWRFIPSATELLRFGVKIEKAKDGSLFDVTFKSGVLQIPPLKIEDRTETFLRNLLAYEEYYPRTLRYITNYMKLIDCLINSANDVEILSRRGIIDNWLSDKEVVSDIFNKISNAVAGPNDCFLYDNVFTNINMHCNQLINKWFAKLRRDYLNSPWGVISVLAALLFLLLTITQTIFTVVPRWAVHKAD